MSDAGVTTLHEDNVHGVTVNVILVDFFIIKRKVKIVVETGIKIVEFKDEYAEKLSEIIQRNLFEVNIEDYPKEEIAKMAESFTKEKILEFPKVRKVFVALDGDEPVGTLSAAKSWGGQDGDYHFLTIFVSPDIHGKGIGRKLIEAGEKYVSKVNGKKITIPSSITSHKFYANRGYKYTNEEPNADGHYIMIKSIEKKKENTMEMGV